MVAALEKAGLQVFIDQRLTVGQTWAREIETQVQQADFLIVFLTAESSRSEMVRGEIEMARHHAADASRPRILPVRVGFDGPLPYPLNAYLDSIQYAVWNRPGRHDAAAARNCSPRSTAARPPSAAGPPPRPVSCGESAAAYAAPLPVPGGTLDVDDPWYLPRPTDATALAVARQPGQTLTIKGPRQMGKSSLLMRTVKAALDAGKKVALLDFQLVDEKSKADADLFFRRFASAIAEQLELPENGGRDCGIPGYSNPQNCTRYVERHILQALDAPCVIAIDETDSIFRTTFSADFFAMLRSWHGLRAHPVRRSWKNLDIILSTSTEPQFFIDRPHESPFNVGVVLPLEDFRLDQVVAAQRATSASARRGRPAAAARARRRASLPHAQGAVHGGEQCADMLDRRAVRRGDRRCRSVRRPSALLPAAAAGKAGAYLRAAPHHRLASRERRAPPAPAAGGRARPPRSAPTSCRAASSTPGTSASACMTRVDAGTLVAAGTVQAGDGVYLERRADAQLLAHCRAGEFSTS